MRHATINFITVCLAVGTACACGCSTIPLDAANVEPASARVNLEIAVGPFEDDRGEYRFVGERCFYSPLMPFGWYFYESPDKTHVSGIGSVAFSPLRESQDIFIDALKKSKIFRKVHLINDWDKDVVGDLEVRGKIIKASCGEKIWTYFLSLPGAVFWLFGAPIFTSTETYAIEIELKRRGDPGPSWTYRAEKEIGVVEGLYYKTNKFDKPLHGAKYKSLRRYMAEVMAAEFIRELDKKLSENPDLFKPAAGAEEENKETGKQENKETGKQENKEAGKQENKETRE